MDAGVIRSVSFIPASEYTGSVMSKNTLPPGSRDIIVVASPDVASDKIVLSHQYDTALGLGLEPDTLKQA